MKWSLRVTVTPPALKLAAAVTPLCGRQQRRRSRMFNDSRLITQRSQVQILPRLQQKCRSGALSPKSDGGPLTICRRLVGTHHRSGPTQAGPAGTLGGARCRERADKHGALLVPLLRMWLWTTRIRTVLCAMLSDAARPATDIERHPGRPVRQDVRFGRCPLGGHRPNGARTPAAWPGGHVTWRCTCWTLRTGSYRAVASAI